MATFTMTLNDVISYGYDIGLQNNDRGYPLFDEAYRPHLNKRITDHFAFREIGHETVEMFIFALNRKLREVMPYYNELYKTTQLTFDPLASTDYTETTTSTQTHAATGTEAATGTNAAETDTASRNVAQDFPQTALAGNQDYATSAADATGKTTVSGSSSSTGTNSANATDEGSISRHMVGRSGSPAQLITEYRMTLLNVDLQVLQELEVCFMQLWDDGSSYTPNDLGMLSLGYYPFGFGGMISAW